MKTSLINYLEETVMRCPDRVAVWDAGKEFTFKEVFVRAQDVARRINVAFSGKGRIVAVYLPKCVGTTIADYGILMSGNGFMNLDVKTPLERIGEILKTVDPVLVITTEKGSESLSEVWHSGRLLIEQTLNVPFEDLPFKDKWDFFGHHMIDADPFCIINTSGSTGIPKGVVTPFRGFHNFVSWTIEEYKLQTDVEVAASVSPVFFDAFVLELLLMSTIGLKQVLVPDSYRMFPIKILQLMREQNVTFFLWVPTIMISIANSGLLERFPVESLKVGWFAGEICPPHQTNQWIVAHPKATFANLYGPMEVTVVCTYYNIPGLVDENKPIPIGKSIENYDVELLDEHEEIISTIGQEGEICVRGSVIAFGYYGLKEKTDAVFRQVPQNDKYEEKFYHTGDYGMYDDNGNIIFCGRKDTLVKHSGYRIELAEIEHAVFSSAKLAQQGCVVYNFKSREIVLFYEASEDLDEGLVRKALTQYLPKYMLPTRFYRFDSMPRNGAGKIDRAFLNRQING